MSDSLFPFRRLQEHRAWVNRLLLEAAEKLSPEQLRRQFSIGQGTLWRTLVHMYSAEYVWLGALEGDPLATLPGDLPGQLPGSQAAADRAPPDGIQSLDELKSNWRQLETRWTAYLDSVLPESVQQPVYKVSTSSGHGRRLATTCGDVLLHLSLHAQYTTAQAINMLRMLGVGPLPDVMLISLARSQHPANA